MESSSDQSFAWTDASNDSIDSDVMMVDNKIKDQSDNESEYGKSYKKKLQQELFAHNGDDNETKLQKKEKKRKFNDGIHDDLDNESPRKKKIKLEPESDIEPSERNKKSKYNERLRLTSKDLLSNDESYLNLRVKEEMAFKVPSPTVNKKKKKKKESDSEANGDNVSSDLNTSLQITSYDDTSCNEFENITQVMDYEGEQSKEKKRKKKKKRKDISEEETETVFVNIKDKFSKEETVVESCYTSNSNHFSNASEQLENQNSNWDFDSDKQLDRNNAKKCKETKNCTLQSEKMSDEDEIVVRSNQQSYNADSGHTNSNKNHDILEKNSLRVARLSERIRFEDESSLHSYGDGSNKIVDLGTRTLEKFLHVKDNLKPISAKLKNESILTQDDEVWIVKCPHNVAVNAFQGVTIPLNKKIKIKVDGNTYEGSIEDHINTVTVLSQIDSTFVLKNLPSKGVINFRKRVPKVHIRDDVMMINNQTDFIPLPETKVRHPLFGSNYKKSIKVPGSVKEQLQASIAVVSVDTKKVTKQKKNKHMIKDSDLMFDLETKHEPQSLEVSKKKSKKRKHIGSDEQTFVKAKQQKYDINSAEVWDSEKAIEENLFNF